MPEEPPHPGARPTKRRCTDVECTGQFQLWLSSTRADLAATDLVPTAGDQDLNTGCTPRGPKRATPGLEQTTEPNSPGACDNYEHMESGVDTDGEYEGEQIVGEKMDSDVGQIGVLCEQPLILFVFCRVKCCIR